LVEKVELHQSHQHITSLGISDMTLAFLEENEKSKAVMQRLAKENHRMRNHIEVLAKFAKKLQPPEVDPREYLSKSMNLGHTI
jgi:hypothetical protein